MNAASKLSNIIQNEKSNFNNSSIDSVNNMMHMNYRSKMLGSINNDSIGAPSSGILGAALMLNNNSSKWGSEKGKSGSGMSEKEQSINDIND